MSFKNFSLRRKSPTPSAPETIESNEEKSMLKRGDEKRIMLMNMVKEGKLSVDNALQRAYGMGIASVPYEELDVETSLSGEKEGKVYNFGVHRYGRNSKSIKCVLQIDGKENSLSLLQRGQKLKSYPFQALKNVISGDDSTRLLIQFDDLDEIEVDAASLEEKNHISRLLLMVISEKRTGIRSESILEMRPVMIKEGVVEKKGHSVAFLMWPKRFLRVLPGEMIYFKLGEEKNENAALSIVSLADDETLVRKLDDNGFVVVTNQKEYIFRISSNKSDEIEKERNDWIIALQEAIRTEKFNQTIHDNNLQNDVTHNDNSLFRQEEYLKSITMSLNKELEQLGVILNIIDAPIRASAQVIKVRDIVHSLNDQIQTGLLSWTLKHAHKQRLSMAETNFEGEHNPTPQKHQLEGIPLLSRQEEKEHAIQESYSHLVLSNHQQQQPKVNDLYNTLHLSTNQDDTNSLSNNSVLSNDSRYTPYPNYRAPSFSEPLVLDETIPQYEPRDMLVASPDGSPDYAKVRKKGVKQKQTAYNPYVNIDHRYQGMNTWPADPPPLPPKTCSLERQYSDSDDITANTSGNMPGCIKNDTTSLCESGTSENSNINCHLNIRSKINVDVVKPHKTFEQHSNVVKPVVSEINGNGVVPAPPPLPNMLSVSKREDTIPNRKMKPFFWTKVPDVQLANTVWKDARNRLHDISTDKLESMFHLVQQTSEPVTSSRKDEKATVKSLLDPKKAQNLGIFLSGFKLSGDDIEEKLSIFDDENGLTSEELNALKRFHPTAEEIEMFKSFKGDTGKDLVKVDQFICKLCNIANLNARLDVLLTIREVPEQIQGIEPPIRNVLEACHNLKSNKNFFRLLEYVLALGNYLNGGTARGCANGFRLSALVKLVEIRSADKKHTILQFLAEELYEKDREALVCYKEMTSLLTPTDISLKGLTAEVEIMSKDINILTQQVRNMSAVFDERFLEKAYEFIRTHSNKLSSLGKQCEEILQLSIELKRMYGENATSDFESWLNHVSDFVKQLQRAAEAADQKQQRLMNRQKLFKDIQMNGSDGAQQSNEMNPMHNDSTRNTQNLSKTKRFKNDADPYDEVISHCTKLKLQGNSPDSQAKLFRVRNANVLQLSSAESMEELSFPTKTGYLEKESGGKKRIRKWDTRFFELTTTGYLHYSKHQDGKLSGAIYLRGCPIRINENESCIIEIYHEQRVWKLRGYNDLDVIDWYNALTYYAQMESSGATQGF